METSKTLQKATNKVENEWKAFGLSHSIQNRKCHMWLGKFKEISRIKCYNILPMGKVKMLPDHWEETNYKGITDTFKELTKLHTTIK